MNLRTKIIQKLIHLNEAIFFYPKLKRFYKQNIGQGPVNILDVGANKGQSIDFFLKVNPDARIHAFEPNKKLFTFLQRKYTNSNIKLHNCGVSNIQGELEFHENILDETSTFESFNPDSKYLEKKARVLGVSKESIIVDNYKVAVIRLADFLDSHPSLSIDVLKIDVEGHELQCLQGLFIGNERPIKFIQLESHQDDMYINNDRHGEIEALLLANGYKPTAQIRHGFGDFAEIIYKNKNY